MSKFNQYYCKWSDNLLLNSEEGFGLIASSTRDTNLLRGVQNFVDKCCLNTHSSVPVQHFCYSDEINAYILAEIQPDVMGKNPVPGLPLFVHIYTMIKEDDGELNPDDYLSPDVFDKNGYEGELSERSFFGCPYAIEDILRMYNFNGPSLGYFFTKVVRTVIGVDEPLCICVNNKPAAAFAEISKNIMFLIHSMLPENMRKMADFASFDETGNEKGFTFYFKNNVMDYQNENVFTLGDTFDIDLDSYIAKFALKFAENIILARRDEHKKMLDSLNDNFELIDGHSNMWEKLVVLMISQNDSINLDDNHYGQLIETYKSFLEDGEENLNIWINALFGIISNSKSNVVYQENSKFVDYILNCKCIDDIHTKALVAESLLTKMFTADMSSTIDKLKSIGKDYVDIAEDIVTMNSSKHDSFAARVMFKEISSYDEMKSLVDNYGSYLGSEKYGDFIAQSAFNIFFNGKVPINEKLDIARLVVSNEPNGRFQEKCCERIAERASVSKRLGVLYKYLIKNNVNLLAENGYLDCNGKVKEEIGNILENQLSLCMSVEDIQEVIKEASQISELLGGNCCDDEQISEGIFSLYSSDFIDKNERRRIANAMVSSGRGENFKRKCGEQISNALNGYNNIDDIVTQLEKVDTENLVQMGAVTFEQKTIDDIGEILSNELADCDTCDKLRTYMENVNRLVAIFGQNYWDDSSIILRAFAIYADENISADEKVAVLVMMESSPLGKQFKEYLSGYIYHEIEYAERITNVVTLINNLRVPSLVKRRYIEVNDKFIQDITDVLTYQLDHCESADELSDISDALYHLATTFGKNYWDNGCIADGVFHLYCDVLKDGESRKEILSLVLSQTEKNRFKQKCNNFIKQVTENSTEISQLYDALVDLDAEVLGKDNYIVCDSEMQQKIAQLITYQLENSKTADEIIYTSSAIEQIATTFGKNYWTGDYIPKGAIHLFANPEVNTYEKRKIFSMMNSSDHKDVFQKLYGEYFVSAIENAKDLDEVYQLVSSFETKTVIKSGYIKFTDTMKDKVSECLIKHIESCSSVDDITDAITAIEDISEIIGANYWNDGVISEGAIAFYARDDVSTYDKKKIYTIISQSTEKEIFFSMYGSYIEEMLANLEDFQDILDIVTSAEAKSAFENGYAECKDDMIKNISKAVEVQISNAKSAEDITDVISAIDIVSEIVGNNYWNNGAISKGAVEFYSKKDTSDLEKSQIFEIMSKSSEKNVFMSLYAELIYKLISECDSLKDVYNILTSNDVRTVINEGYITCTDEVKAIISEGLKVYISEASSVEDIMEAISIIEDVSEYFGVSEWFDGTISKGALNIYANDETSVYERKRIFDIITDSAEKDYFMAELGAFIEETIIQSDDIEYICDTVSMQETVLAIKEGYLKCSNDIQKSISNALVIKLGDGKTSDDISTVMKDIDDISEIFGKNYWNNGVIAEGAINLYANDIPNTEKKKIFDLLINTKEKKYFLEFYGKYVEEYISGDVTLENINVLLNSNEVKTAMEGGYLTCTDNVQNGVTNALVKAMKNCPSASGISDIVKYIENISAVFGYNYWQNGSISKGAIAFYSKKGISNYERRKLFNLMVNSAERNSFLELYSEYVNKAVAECAELDDIYTVVSSFETKTAIEGGFVKYSDEFKNAVSKALISKIAESVSADDITDAVSTIEEISEIIGKNYWQNGSVAKGSLALYLKNSTPAYERRRIFDMMTDSDENDEFQQEFAKYAYNTLVECDDIDDVLDLLNTMEYKYSTENSYLILDERLAKNLEKSIKYRVEKCTDASSLSKVLLSVNRLIKLFGFNYWADGCVAEGAVQLYYKTNSIKEKQKILDIMDTAPDADAFIDMYSRYAKDSLYHCNSIIEMSEFIELPDIKSAIEIGRIVCDKELKNRITSLLNYELLTANNAGDIVANVKAVTKISSILAADDIWNEVYYEEIADKLISVTHLSDMEELYNCYYPIFTDKNRLKTADEFIEYLENYNPSEQKVQEIVDFIQKLNDDMEDKANIIDYAPVKKVIPIPYQYDDGIHKVFYSIEEADGEYKLYNPLSQNIEKKKHTLPKFNDVNEEPLYQEPIINEEFKEEYNPPIYEEPEVEEEFTTAEEPEIGEEIEVNEEPEVEEEIAVDEEPEIEEEIEVNEEPEIEEEIAVDEEPEIEEEIEVNEEPEIEEQIAVEEEPKIEEKTAVVEEPKVEEKPIVEEPKKKQQYVPKLNFSREKIMEAKKRVQESLAEKNSRNNNNTPEQPQPVQPVEDVVKIESNPVENKEEQVITPVEEKENKNTFLPNKKPQGNGRGPLEKPARKLMQQETPAQTAKEENHLHEQRFAQREVLSVNNKNNNNNNNSNKSEPLITISKREPAPEIVKEKPTKPEIDLSTFDGMGVNELVKKLYSSSDSAEKAVIAGLLEERTRKNDILQLCDVNVALKHHGFTPITVPYAAWVTIEPLEIIDKVIETGIDLSLIESSKSPKYQVTEAVVRLWVDDNMSFIHNLFGINRDTYDLARDSFFKMCIIKPFREVNIKSIFALSEIENTGKYDFGQFFRATRDNKAKLEEYIENVSRVDKSAGKDLKKAYKRYSR